jgi:hypothetical protein
MHKVVHCTCTKFGSIGIKYWLCYKKQLTAMVVGGVYSVCKIKAKKT